MTDFKHILIIRNYAQNRIETIVIFLNRAFTKEYNVPKWRNKNKQK